MSLRCHQCGSERIVPKAIIWDQGQGSRGTLQAYVYANPDAVFFKGAAYATLYARICAQCGHATLFAEGADALYEAFTQSRATDHDGRMDARGVTESEAATQADCLACGKPKPPGDNRCPACGSSWSAAEQPT